MPGSAGRGAALAAEPRPGQRRPAVPAELLGGRRGGQPVAAALAELAAAALLAALGTQAGALVAVVDVLGPVLALDLLVQLVDLRRGLHPGDLLVQLGGAGHAQAPLAVPAHLLAHPLAAAVALVEERLHLLDGVSQRLVGGRAAHAVAHPLGVPAELLGLLADGAAYQVAAEPQQPPAEAGDRMLERRAVPVAAATAPPRPPDRGHVSRPARAYRHDRRGNSGPRDRPGLAIVSVISSAPDAGVCSSVDAAELPLIDWPHDERGRRGDARPPPGTRSPG